MAIHDCPKGRHPKPAYTCYRRCRCRCQHCSAFNARQRRDWTLTYHRAGLVSIKVDAATTCALVEWLVDAGAEQQWIAHEAGVSQAWVSEIRRGRWSVVRSSTADKVRELARRVAAGEVKPGALL